MGWYFGFTSRKAVIAELTNDTDTVHTLRKYTSGNTLWTVQEVVKTGERFIGCYLMNRHSGEDWGYKPMEESMGPCETTCPPCYFDMVPCPEGYAVDWRKRVLADHARRNMRLKKGDTVRLSNGRDYRVLSAKPLRGMDGSGMIYRLPRRMIEALVTPLQITVVESKEHLQQLFDSATKS